MPLFTSQKKVTPRQKLRVLVFTSADWGFTDASLPKLRAIVAKLEEAEAELQVWHSSLTARFFGEEREEAFFRAKDLLEEAQKDSDFSGFHLGVAEGDMKHELDVVLISGEAFKNARRG